MRQELKEQLLKGVVTIILCTSVFFAARQAAVLVNEGTAQKTEQFCVVIDAGHGGDDPGKIGINGPGKRSEHADCGEAENVSGSVGREGGHDTGKRRRPLRRKCLQ